MERLQQHDNTKVYETAYKIIDNFFNGEDEVGDVAKALLLEAEVGT